MQLPWGGFTAARLHTDENLSDPDICLNGILS